MCIVITPSTSRLEVVREDRTGQELSMSVAKGRQVGNILHRGGGGREGSGRLP